MYRHVFFTKNKDCPNRWPMSMHLSSRTNNLSLLFKTNVKRFLSGIRYGSAKDNWLREGLRVVSKFVVCVNICQRESDRQTERERLRVLPVCSAFGSRHWRVFSVLVNPPPGRPNKVEQLKSRVEVCSVACHVPLVLLLLCCVADGMPLKSGCVLVLPAPNSLCICSLPRWHRRFLSFRVCQG